MAIDRKHLLLYSLRIGNSSRQHYLHQFVTGTNIITKDENGNSTFRFEPGPIFANLVLADEINRAPAKVQSALLEAMQERQVTIGDMTYRLPEPFLVMATQNPIEQEGTYPLPEAQVDRFNACLISAASSWP